MIRIDEINRAWSDDFLKYDELLIPIMISEGAKKEIRIKAARFAYRIGLISEKIIDNCISAIEQEIRLFTKESKCGGPPETSTENKQKNTNKIQSLQPFNKPKF